LRASLEDTEAANAAALIALQTMADDTIVTRLIQQDSLTKDDEAYLKKIDDQYQAFAGGQSNSLTSLKIRADAKRQSAGLKLKLSQVEAAIDQHKQATELFRSIN
jgi:hypothetical protein